MERLTTPFSVELGRRVARRRRILGLTQRQVAAHVGVHRAHITQVEGGIYQSMRFEQLAKLADILQTSADYLLQRVVDDPGVIPPIRCPAEGCSLDGLAPLPVTTFQKEHGCEEYSTNE